MSGGEPRAGAAVACLTVGLTGGVASGKSAVAQCFRNLGAALIDADQVARELAAPGQPAFGEIVEIFGTQLLRADGTLDRQRLRARIFENTDDRKRLEAILHPRVRASMFEQARNCARPYCVLMIPLLAESPSSYAWLHRVLVIDAPVELRRARLIRRDQITPQLALQMLAAQATREQRLAVATDVINNDAGAEQLGLVINKLHSRYLRLSAALGFARTQSQQDVSAN